MIFEKMRPRLHQSAISHVRPPAPGRPIPLERYRKSGPGGGGGWYLGPPQPPLLFPAAKSGPGRGGGWKLGPPQPPCSSCLLPSCSSNTVFMKRYRHRLTHAGPGGRRTSPACGSCRRPRKERQRKRGAMSRRTTHTNEKIKRTRKKQKERENKTQRRGTASNETKGSTADVAQSMLSRSEDHVSPARETESIVRKPKIHHFPS